jgi:phage baseplate assembly protein V
MMLGFVKTIIEGAIKRFSADGHTDETIDDREYYQHYGLTSRPLPGAEVVIINEGNNYVAIASDDRRYRIGIEEGEVCIYTDEGDHVRFKRGKEIYVKSGGKITIEVENEVTITCPSIKMDGDITLTGNISMTGDLAVTGNVSATGSIIDGGGNTNHHSHG